MADWSTAYVEPLPRSYRVEYDDTLALAHLPKVVESGDPKDPTELEAVYYRIVRGPTESCIEYIYYWNFQLFPTHSYDYEPIYVYLANNTVKRTAFDLLHYKARVFPTVSCFMIWGLWHGFLSIGTPTSKPIERQLMRLDDAILGRWYKRGPKAIFEIKQKLTDPWLLRDWSTFRDERVLPRSQGLFLMTAKDKEAIESDEEMQGAINRESLTLAVRDINRFYQRGSSIEKVLRSVPKEPRTDKTTVAVAKSMSRTQRMIFNQFRKAGYVKTVNGRATWTSKGQVVRKTLSSNLRRSTP